jgi:hypothetical protein
MPKANVTQNISSRPEFNGCFACVIGAFNPESGRWPVRVIVTQGSRAHLCACSQLKTKRCELT